MHNPTYKEVIFFPLAKFERILFWVPSPFFSNMRVLQHCHFVMKLPWLNIFVNVIIPKFANVICSSLYDPFLPILTKVVLFFVLYERPTILLWDIELSDYILIEASKQLWTFHCWVSGCLPTRATLSWLLKKDTFWLPSFGELKTLNSFAFEETSSKVGLEEMQLLSNTVSG